MQARKQGAMKRNNINNHKTCAVHANKNSFSFTAWNSKHDQSFVIIIGDVNSTIKEQQQQQQNQQQRHGVFKQDDVFWPFETVKPKLSYTFFNSWFLAQRERERETETETESGGGVGILSEMKHYCRHLQTNQTPL